MPTPASKRCFRKKRSLEEEEADAGAESGDEEERRMALEEVKLLQKHRERPSGIPALPTASSSSGGDVTGGAAAFDPLTGGLRKMGQPAGSAAGDGEKDDLVLQDTFAQETAVTVEDPNMCDALIFGFYPSSSPIPNPYEITRKPYFVVVIRGNHDHFDRVKYVEQELAKRQGKNVNGDGAHQSESELKRLEDELYAVPEHLKLKKKNPEESSTQWTTGIAEIQLPIEYKLKNIEETEAAKKLLQEKRLMASRAKSDLHIPSSYSADYFQRGRDYAEKLRRDHPELYKKDGLKDGAESGGGGASGEGAPRRQAATDVIMLERFRKRERQRAMRR